MPTTTTIDSEMEENRILLLAVCLLERSNHRGFDNDISEAIQIAERGMEAFPSVDIIPGRIRKSLAELLYHRFVKQRNFKDLDKAIEIQKRLCQEESIRDSKLRTLGRQRGHLRCVLDFSNFLLQRYEITGQHCSLLASIESEKTFLAGVASRKGLRFAALRPIAHALHQDS